MATVTGSDSSALAVDESGHHTPWQVLHMPSPFAWQSGLPTYDRRFPVPSSFTLEHQCCR